MISDISIIIPVYNAEKYLRKCIGSVIAQTCKDWEMILINDGSKDDSLAICQEYAEMDERIRVIDKENGGPSSARNKGLEEARGKYVYFMDADDWIEKNFLESFFNLNLNPNDDNYDIIFQGFVRESSGGREDKSFAMNADTSIMSKEEIICRLYKEHVYGWSWCKLFRREIIDKYHLRFDESLRLWEDELFTTEFLQHADKIKTINSHLYHYICHTESIMHTNDKRYEKVFLSKRMIEALEPIANRELWTYVNDVYNKELKYTLIMSLKNENFYKCDFQIKTQILDIYYDRCNKFPELKRYNVLRNKFSYTIAELILQTRCKRFINFVFSML